MSHSKSDEIGKKFFNQLFGSTEHEAYWYSFEGPKPPHAKTILEKIRSSASVFVILSKPMEAPWTRSWVGYEVGIAATLGIDVWVFEQKDSEYVDVPVPYLTGYIQYPKEIERKDTFPYFDLVKSAGTLIPIREIKVVPIDPFGYSEYQNFITVFCGYQNCKAKYWHWVYKNYLCPVCRRDVHKGKLESMARHFSVNSIPLKKID